MIDDFVKRCEQLMQEGKDPATEISKSLQIAADNVYLQMALFQCCMNVQNVNVMSSINSDTLPIYNQLQTCNWDHSTFDYNDMCCIDNTVRSENNEAQDDMAKYYDYSVDNSKDSSKHKCFKKEIRVALKAIIERIIKY